MIWHIIPLAGVGFYVATVTIMTGAYVMNVLRTAW